MRDEVLAPGARLRGLREGRLILAPDVAVGVPESGDSAAATATAARAAGARAAAPAAAAARAAAAPRASNSMSKAAAAYPEPCSPAETPKWPSIPHSASSISCPCETETKREREPQHEQQHGQQSSRKHEHKHDQQDERRRHLLAVRNHILHNKHVPVILDEHAPPLGRSLLIGAVARR